jgi:hypothetical protein
MNPFTDTPHWNRCLHRLLVCGWPSFVKLPAPEIQFEHTEVGIALAAHVRELEQAEVA